jgi:hypothetical protein
MDTGRLGEISKRGRTSNLETGYKKRDSIKKKKVKGLKGYNFGND